MRQLQRLGHWLAGLSPGGFARPACQRARWRCCTHRVRTTLSTLVTMTYHAAGGRCRNWACQVRSWSFEGAGLDLDTGGRLDRLHIRVHLWWVSRWIRRLLVVTAGARCPLTKPAVAAVELQATTEPHCSRGVQPGGICVYVPGARGRACARTASASCASSRSVITLIILAHGLWRHTKAGRPTRPPRGRTGFRPAALGGL